LYEAAWQAKISLLHFCWNSFSTHSIPAEELRMVGPHARVWKVLRETDGERFVREEKVAVFKDNSQTAKMKIQ
jgi:hypothetical protein